MPTTTKGRLVQTAHDLFYSEGFHTVGLDRILDTVGVTKTTFYNHFSSKDDLIVEALRWHDEWWQSTFRKMLRRLGGDLPRGQLLAVPDAVAEMFQDQSYNGCIFINVAVQFPLPHDPAHQLAEQHKDAMEDILREIAGYAGASDPKALAEEIGLIMEGAYVTRQVSRRDSTVDAVRRMVTLVVEKHLGP